MDLRKPLLALALLLLPVGAAGEMPDFKSTAHTIALVSLLGDGLDYGGGPSVPVPDAGFDDVAERAMGAQIALDLPAAHVERVGGDTKPLIDAMYLSVGYGDIGMTRVREALEDWAATHPVDYIVILRKTVGVIEDRPAGHSMTYQSGFFGIGRFRGVPTAFLNLTILDGHTLDVVADQSVRDLNWASSGPEPTGDSGRPRFVDDVRAMLSSIAPALVHQAGM